MGYADVGADIYVVLGVIATFAGVVSPLAFGIASLVYVCTGLCYAELATAYPVAGGGQYYALKAFGRIHGFVAGWGLMLDYTIDIALFALATVGYLNIITQEVIHTNIISQSPYYGLTAIALILMLLALNVIGIKYSSKFNEFIVAVDLVTVGVFLAFGLPTIISSGALATWVGNAVTAFKTGSFGAPGYSNFIYAVSLATASFIGIESISQAAEETKNPSRVIPKATKWAIVSVIVVALSLSMMSVTLLPWQEVVANSQAPAVPLATHLPFIGAAFAVWIALMGTLVCYISTNTGVVGVSRVMFSMGRLKLLPKGLAKVSARFRTPYVTITIFTVIACVLIGFNLALPGISLLDLITSIYNFGALVAYMYVNAAAVVLRVKEPDRPGWKMPLNFSIGYKGGEYRISVIPIVGFVAAMIVWFIIVGLHPTGRLVGSIWFAVGIVGYLIYQKRKGGNKADA